MSVSDQRLGNLQTPALILDETRMLHNIQRLADHIGQMGVTLRPHLKTTKSIEIAKKILKGGNGPATVSTLAEAEVFAGVGIMDIIYAVGIAPQKLDRVATIRANGCDLSVILDSVEQARAVAEAAERFGQAIPTFIELDCDGHRSGVSPGSPVLTQIAHILHESAAELRGVLTHAGESYGAYGHDAHAEFSEQERHVAVEAAETLRGAGLPCPVVSVGSTPTAHAIQKLDGVTEVRAGVHAFFDLVQAGIGVCRIEDIALTVLTTVIGHKRDKGWIITDAGWMAMSQDRGTSDQKVDQGYGVVCDAAGSVIPDLIVIGVNQEHGIIAPRHGATSPLPNMPLGTQLRILPNHACSTSAQFAEYNVVPTEANVDLKVWPRFGGW